MPITNTISLPKWQDVVSASTGNPAAEQEIVRMAKDEALLVEDDNRLFVPVESGGTWLLVESLTERQVADALSVAVHEAHRLLLEADVPSFRSRERLFSTEKLWRWEDLKERLQQYVAAHGIAEREAALELGLTQESYRRLIDLVPFNSDGRVHKSLLEGWRNGFLPRNKVWSTRSSLVSEFVENYNRANPDAQLELQPCEVVGCGHAASDQCVNSGCRDGAEPRFVCPAHANWVDGGHIARRPRSLCPRCATRVREGELGSFKLL